MRNSSGIAVLSPSPHPFSSDQERALFPTLPELFRHSSRVAERLCLPFFSPGIPYFLRCFPASASLFFLSASFSHSAFRALLSLLAARRSRPLFAAGVAQLGSLLRRFPRLFFSLFLLMPRSDRPRRTGPVPLWHGPCGLFRASYFFLRSFTLLFLVGVVDGGVGVRPWGSDGMWGEGLHGRSEVRSGQ